MKKYLFTIVYSFLFLALFSSCSFLNLFLEDNTSSLPSYTPDVQWSLKTNTYGGSSTIKQHDRYLYLIEEYKDDPEKITYGIAKIDLQTGSYVWKSSELTKCLSLSEPVACGDYVFLEKPGGANELPSSIYCFSDLDGKLLATITFGNSEREKHARRISNRSLYSIEDQYLIWSNGYIRSDYEDFDFGILRIDISKIDFSVEPETEQYICPETLLKLDRSIYTHFENNGEVVFYTTYNAFDDCLDCITGAINAVTGEKLWSRESADMRGTGVNGLYFLNDPEKKLTNRLYSFECYVGCYNTDSGDTIWEKIQTVDEIVDEAYIGGLIYDEGVFYSDGCFYYTTAEFETKERNPDVISNIKCMDAKTGKVKWGYIPKNSSSLFTRPIVANGKVFVLTFEQGLYVFDKDTGKLLGVDESIYAYGYEKNALYNGNVIFFDFASGQGVLKAIKP